MGFVSSGRRYRPGMTDLPADALRVVATLPIDPARATEAAAALATLAAASREEEGCYAYDVFESATVPGTFVTVEAWRSQADMDAHMGTPHIGKAFEVLGPAIAGDIAIHPLKAV
jgi:quinol monooxygenase YgiN